MAWGVRWPLVMASMRLWVAQMSCHSPDARRMPRVARRRMPMLCLMRAWGCLAGCFLQVAVLAGGDEPVRAGAGEVRVAEVAGVAEGQPDLPGPRAAGRGHHGGCGCGFLRHGLPPAGVGGVIGEAGGEDEAVVGDHVL